MIKRPFLAVNLAFVLILAILASSRSVSANFTGVRGPESPQSLFIPPADHAVAIKDSGFDPQALSIYTGESVTWTNTTSTAVGLGEGFIYKVYLPLVIKNSSSGSSAPNGTTPVDQSSAGIPIDPADTYTRIFATTGTYHFYTTGNLSHTFTLSVLAHPDLQAFSLALNPNPAAVNTAATISTRINNLGAGAALAFEVTWQIFSLDSVTAAASGTWHVTGLAAGEHTDLTAEVTLATAGPYTLQVTADPTAVLADVDTSNNGMQIEMGVTGRIDYCGNISSDTTWAYATYSLTCDVTIEAGASLTIRNGAVIKAQRVDDYGGGMMVVNGNLNATGTGTDPIVFTSLHDDAYGGDTDASASVAAPGDWDTLMISSTGSANFEHVRLRYGGGYRNGLGVNTELYNNGGELTLSGSTVENSLGKGIRVETGGTLEIEDSFIQYNGSIGLDFDQSGGAATPSISGTNFNHNSGYAAHISLNSVTFNGANIHGNTAASNTLNGIGLSAGFTGASNLSGQAGMAYILDGDTIIATGAVLSIDPGAVLKLIRNGDYAGGVIFVNGSMIANGNAGHPIVFTSLNDDDYAGDTNGSTTAAAAGDWDGIYISAGKTGSISFARLRYGGGLRRDGSVSAALCDRGGDLTLAYSTLENSISNGVRVESGSTLNVTDSIIQNNSGNGLDLAQSGGAITPVITGTNFNHNSGYAVHLNLNSVSLSGANIQNNSAASNTYNGIGLSATFAGPNDLSAHPGMAYILDGDTVISSGATLTVSAGAVIKLIRNDDYAGGVIYVNGSLSLPGTEAAPIIFTSLNDDDYGGDTNGSATAAIPGDWDMIYVPTGGTLDMHYTTLRYGGGARNALWVFAELYDSGGSVTVTRSTFRESYNNGIWFDSPGSLHATDTTFTNNEVGIFFTGNHIIETNVVITNCRFEGNATWGLNNGSPATIHVENNWWGAASGPYNLSSNPTGTGNPVSDGVIFSPFLTVRPTW